MPFPSVPFLPLPGSLSHLPSTRTSTQVHLRALCSRSRFIPFQRSPTFAMLLQHCGDLYLAFINHDYNHLSLLDCDFHHSRTVSGIYQVPSKHQLNDSAVMEADQFKSQFLVSSGIMLDIQRGFHRLILTSVGHQTYTENSKKGIVIKDVIPYTPSERHCVQ